MINDRWQAFLTRLWTRILQIGGNFIQNKQGKKEKINEEGRFYQLYIMFLRVMGLTYVVFEKFSRAKMYFVFTKKPKRYSVWRVYIVRKHSQIAIENPQGKQCFSLLFYWKMLFPPIQAPFLTTFWEVNDTLNSKTSLTLTHR